MVNDVDFPKLFQQIVDVLDQEIYYYGLYLRGGVMQQKFEMYLEVESIDSKKIKKIEDATGLYCYEMYNIQDHIDDKTTNNIRIVFTNEDRR